MTSSALVPAVYSTDYDLALVERAANLVPVLAERAPLYDRENRFPTENFADFHQAGLLGLLIPEAEGGLGGSYQTFAAIVRVLARGYASTAQCFLMHCAGTQMVAVNATPEQKARYLRPVLAEGAIFSVSYSEPGTGSNFMSPQTMAQRSLNQDGQDGYVLNGEKFFSTSAGTARFFIINTAIADADKALNVFVLDMQNTAGVEVRHSWDAMGMRANSSNDLVFKDCFVAEADRLGEHGGGIAVIRAKPSAILLALGAVPVGIAEAALDYTIEHARTRVLAHNQKPLSHMQGLRFMIAEMKIAIDAARLMLENTARTADENPAGLGFSFMANKYLANTTAVEVCNKALQICGGRGYFKRNPIERYLRDAHAGGIMATTLENARDVIGKLLLGLDPNGSE